MDNPTTAATPHPGIATAEPHALVVAVGALSLLALPLILKRSGSARPV